MNESPTSETPAAEPPLAAGSGITRRARVLLGWLTEEEARLFQNGRRGDLPPNVEHDARAARAREYVRQRAAWIADAETVTEAGAVAQGRLDTLRANPSTAPFIPNNARVAMVRLDRVCAAQPCVHIEHADERTRAAIASDDGLLDVTLPLPQAQQLPVQQCGTPQQVAWVLSNLNPNLKVVANVQGPQGGLGQLVGFVVGIATSLVTVAELAGRLILTDGYHRAYGLLARGVRLAPVLFRPCISVEELGLPPGMLRQDAWLGERPALLGDYLNPDVSAEISLPATQKVIVVQATTIDLNTSAW